MRNIGGLILLMVVAGVAGCKTKEAATPLDQLNSQQTHGHAVFLMRCAACHHDRKEGPLHGPSLLGVFKKPSLPSGAAATDERVTATIHVGRGLMPPLGDTIDPRDVDDLLAYLHTL